LRRNFLVQHVIGGKIEGWRREDEQEEDVSSHWMIFKETRGYWRLKGEALDRPLYRTALRKTDNRMNILLSSANVQSATQERLICEVPEFDLPKI